MSTFNSLPKKTQVLPSPQSLPPSHSLIQEAFNEHLLYDRPTWSRGQIDTVS